MVQTCNADITIFFLQFEFIFPRFLWLNNKSTFFFICSSVSAQIAVI